MPPAPALSTAVRALSTGGETAFRAQTAHPLEKSLRPTNGLLAPGELPAGIMGATTVSALLSGISGSTQVPFDGHLRELCDDLAARFGRSGGPRLTCEAADEALPMNATTLFALIAEVLVTDAFVHGCCRRAAAGSPCPSRPGRRPGSSPSTIAVSPYDPTMTRATIT